MGKEGSHPRNISARVYSAAVQSIANASFVALTFDSERWDTDSIHSATTNPSRLTCRTAGKYLVVASICFVTNSTGVRQIYIYKNTTERWAMTKQGASIDANGRIFIATILDLAVGDYVESFVYQSSGGSLDTFPEDYWVPDLMMQRLV